MGNQKRRNRAYTVGKAAEELTRRLGYPVSHQMVWYYIHRGVLPSIQLMGPGGWHRIPVSELERFIERKTTKGLDNSDARA